MYCESFGFEKRQGILFFLFCFGTEMKRLLIGTEQRRAEVLIQGFGGNMDGL